MIKRSNWCTDSLPCFWLSFTIFFCPFSSIHRECNLNNFRSPGFKASTLRAIRGGGGGWNAFKKLYFVQKYCSYYPKRKRTVHRSAPKASKYDRASNILLLVFIITCSAPLLVDPMASYGFGWLPIQPQERGGYTQNRSMLSLARFVKTKISVSSIFFPSSCV